MATDGGVRCVERTQDTVMEVVSDAALGTVRCRDGRRQWEHEGMTRSQCGMPGTAFRHEDVRWVRGEDAKYHSSSVGHEKLTHRSWAAGHHRQ